MSARELAGVGVGRALAVVAQPSGTQALAAFDFTNELRFVLFVEVESIAH